VRGAIVRGIGSDSGGLGPQRAALCATFGQAFYNTSLFTLRDLKARARDQQLTSDFNAYFDGFSPNVQDILINFEFRNIILRLAKADALGTMIAKFLDPEINVSPFFPTPFFHFSSLIFPFCYLFFSGRMFLPPPVVVSNMR
jgi:hypothetical protein